MECEIILQIFSGGFLGETVSYETVEKKLLSVLPALPVKKVIMGWAPGKALYEKTAEFLAQRNIDFYLWLPVFSETGAIRELAPLIDMHGRPFETVKSLAAEDFSFYCPNNPRNIDKILDIFEQEFAAVPFSGVFLDKIRYPSFAQESVFSCFCPHCLKEYEAAHFSPPALENALSRPMETPLGIKSYLGNGNYVYEDNDISKYFSLKAGIILKSMQRICAFFRERGLKIGFDVFAPFLSAFVGQDLTGFSNLCDFMKPMMYRVTNGPAGLPFEMEAFLSGTNSGEAAKRQAFNEILGLDQGKKDFDLDFTLNELRRLASSCACPVYAGVEINRKENIADVKPEYIEETLPAYARTGIRGLVLSWDLISMPEENLKKVKEIMEKLN